MEKKMIRKTAIHTSHCSRAVKLILFKKFIPKSTKLFFYP
jgi:hypothetical protein